jgi:hypothetical protein
MAVKEWIGEFLERHKARFDPHDWPAAEAAEERLEYTRTWVTAFSLKSITRDEADEASRRLGPTPPNYRREHIPMVVHAVEQLRAERSPTAAAGGTRDEAKLASFGCEHCGGEGLATVYHPRPSDENRIAKTYAAYCVCALGRWTRHNHAQHSPDLLHRIPDFEHVLAGGSAYLAEPPAVIAKGGWPS